MLHDVVLSDAGGLTQVDHLVRLPGGVLGLRPCCGVSFARLLGTGGKGRPVRAGPVRGLVGEVGGGEGGCVPDDEGVVWGVVVCVWGGAVSAVAGAGVLFSPCRAPGCVPAAPVPRGGVIGWVCRVRSRTPFCLFLPGCLASWPWGGSTSEACGWAGLGRAGCGPFGACARGVPALPAAACRSGALRGAPRGGGVDGPRGQATLSVRRVSARLLRLTYRR